MQYLTVFELSRIADERCLIEKSTDDSSITMDGEFIGGMKFSVKTDFRIYGGNLVNTGNGTMTVCGCSEIVLFINIGTDVRKTSPHDELSHYPIPEVNYDTIYHTNLANYREHYGRLTLSVEEDAPDIPTDERVMNFKNKGMDNTLPILYFNYGRYLLCASSARGELPANLQGKWNEEIFPAWDCDYHNDINMR